MANLLGLIEDLTKVKQLRITKCKMLISIQYICE